MIDLDGQTVPESALRIAMWSGPRNISTALMRAWENRPDTAVCDEPLYAHYLQRTGAEHPGREQVLAAQDTDWRAVVRELTGPVPGGSPIFYQKHMAHHLFEDMHGDWLSGLRHAFLVREPEEMLTSLLKVIPDPGVFDTGLAQQWDLFQRVSEARGEAAPVLDARDVLEQPGAVLERLCGALDVRFLEQMLSWPPGPRDSDGAWASIWYSGVNRSTGFQPYRAKDDRVPDRLRGVLDACRIYYDKLYSHRLTPVTPLSES
ncbi:MAG: HAD family hydrolase [Gemmatimonadota bacterium]